MLNLKNITLVCADCLNYDGAIKAMEKSCKEITFGQVKFFSDKLLTDYTIIIDRIKSKKEYSYFIHNELVNYINTEFVLIIQSDGFAIHPELWNDEFLNYDYIGAPWWYNDGYNVGNGGFSLRSKRLMKIVQKLNFEAYHPEDDSICRKQRDWLEYIHGIKFAPEEIAIKFSYEPNWKYPHFRNNTFGFHGVPLYLIK